MLGSSVPTALEIASLSSTALSESSPASMSGSSIATSVPRIERTQPAILAWMSEANAKGGSAIAAACLVHLAAGVTVLNATDSTKVSKIGGAGAIVRRNRSHMNGFAVMTG